MLTNYPANPRIRTYGKARIDLAERLKASADWEKLWKPPSNPFPFTWGQSWKQCVEYRVDDFTAEVGFFVDVLGFPIYALDSGYAMFTSPQNDFFFAVVPTYNDEHSNPPDAFRLQFMVRDVKSIFQELLHRGIAFELEPQPLCPGSSISIASFRTPNDICVELWCETMENSASPSAIKIYRDEHVLDTDDSLHALDQGNEDDRGENFEEDEDEDEDDKDIGEDEESDEEDIENGDNDESEEDTDEEDEEEDEDEFEYDDDEYEVDEEDEEDEEEDEEEDDFDEDEYSALIITTPQRINPLVSSPRPQAIESIFVDESTNERQDCLLEYIDLETA
jgi:catechol 2,3-dioxygenase-like lactoylglutathione lyase family enzyme